MRLWAADDWAIMAASASTVVEDLNGLTGRRGYGMGLERPTGLSVLLGQLPSARQGRERALRGQFLRKDGSLVPWFEPLQMLARADRKEWGGDLGAGVRSVIALAKVVGGPS